MRIEKALKNLDLDTIKELEAASEQDLRTRIVQANQAIELAQNELEQNVQYQELKESLKLMSQSLRDLKKRQNSIITVAVNHLNKEG